MAITDGKNKLGTEGRRDGAAPEKLHTASGSANFEIHGKDCTAMEIPVRNRRSDPDPDFPLITTT
jgi:hypothetical protein